MEELRQGMFARSLAGHDRGRLYVVIREKDGYVYLADGKLRTLDKLKKKKRKHVQPDYGTAPELEEKTARGLALRDEDIRKAIKSKEVKVCQRQM
mgnify:CR=1 FL=1